MAVEGIVFLGIFDIVRKEGVWKDEANADVGRWQTVKIYSCLTKTSSNVFFPACDFAWTFLGYQSVGN